MSQLIHELYLCLAVTILLLTGGQQSVKKAVPCHGFSDTHK